jgi:hypothetical protein
LVYPYIEEYDNSKSRDREVMMCNAYNHSPECCCGWGPPYPWRTVDAISIGWEERVAASDVGFEWFLNEMGLNANISRIAMNDYRAQGFPRSAAFIKNMDQSDRSSLRNWLRSLLGGVEVHTLKSEQRRIMVPMFMVSAPPPLENVLENREDNPLVDGKNSTTFIAKENNYEKSTFKIAFMGTYFGRSREISVTNTENFKVSGDDLFCVVQPVYVELDLMDVWIGGQLRSNIVQVDFSDPPRGERCARGVKRCDKKICGAMIAGNERWIFPHGGCDQNVISTHRISINSNRFCDLGLDIQVFGLGVQCLVRVRREVDVVLEFSMIGGADYVVHRAGCAVDGIIWGPLEENERPLPCADERTSACETGGYSSHYEPGIYSSCPLSASKICPLL